MDKVKHAKEVIEYAIKTYPKIGVACSFGKDSMVAVHLAREVDPNIEVFAVMTMFKPQETYDYLRKMNRKMNLNTTIYMVGNSAPEAFSDETLDVKLLPAQEYETISSRIETEKGAPIYKVDPDECCRLLKVDPTKAAVSNLDAWITGLRNTEGRTRTDYEEIENKGGLMKINPILTFTEAEIWSYMSTRGIEPHPWYSQGYRSLGCGPCSSPGGELERDGRWQDTSKCGGECGIHTQVLK